MIFAFPPLGPTSARHAKRTMCTVRYAGSRVKREVWLYVALRPRDGECLSSVVVSA